MTKPEQEFLAIEEEIKEICSGFHGIFYEHGIAEGGQKNFWNVIDGNLQLYNQRKDKDERKLLETWSKCYRERVKSLRQYHHRMRKLINKIYSENEEAKHIVKRLKTLSTEKGWLTKKKINGLLRSIKKECEKLLGVVESLQNLRIDLNHHSDDLKKKIRRSETDLETLKKEEYKYAEDVRNKMIEIGEEGWKIVCRIYSEAEEAKQPLFKKLRAHFLT